MRSSYPILAFTLLTVLSNSLALAEESPRFPVDHGWDRPIFIHSENSWFEAFKSRHGYAPTHDAIIKVHQPTKLTRPNRLPCDGSTASEFHA